MAERATSTFSLMQIDFVGDAEVTALQAAQQPR
jgi:hypothetical protein